MASPLASIARTPYSVLNQASNPTRLRSGDPARHAALRVARSPARRTKHHLALLMRQIGRFELDPDTRTLRCGTERVRIGSRAFDILALLATARGRVVTKDELIQYVWPDTIVEENTLQVHLSALRKALGADRD